jgi:hypothetical protein
MFPLIVSIIFLCCIFGNQIEKINKINNRILNQKTEIIKINNICERILLSKINYHINNINDNYIYVIIIIIIIQLIIIFIIIYLELYNQNKHDFSTAQIVFNLAIILLCSYIIVLIISIIIHVNFNRIIKIINNIETNIINKKKEIHNFYRTKLLSVIDTTDDINYINNNIDEYIEISNDLYIDKFLNIDMYLLYKSKNIKIDKNGLINELKNILIKNKHNELMINMKESLINMEITPEIVKNKLDEIKYKLEEYKISLEMKIAKINELTQINEVIINL